MRLMRMLAANSDILSAYNCKYAFFKDLKVFLYEYGLMLNDRLNHKMALLSCATGAPELFKKLNADINSIIAPEAAGAELSQDILDKHAISLMKQLENTIVTFDRDSLNSAKKSSNRERMRV